MANKYRAVSTWACIKCLKVSDPIRSHRKGSRDCTKCGTMNSVWCFSSNREFRRWHDLVQLERLGEIVNLQYQPSFHLIIKGTSVGKYTADSRYFVGTEEVIEEVKGKETRDGLLRRKVAEAIYKISVKVVK